MDEKSIKFMIFERRFAKSGTIRDNLEARKQRFLEDAAEKERKQRVQDAFSRAFKDMADNIPFVADYDPELDGDPEDEGLDSRESVKKR